MKTLQLLSDPFRRFLRDENAATAIEYALIAAGIAGAIIGTVMALGPKVGGLYQSVSDAWPS
jgi:pilus assembly protein Flp/PilA